MNDSLPTIEQVNLNTYWEIVRQLEPKFYLIRVALQETGVNPMLMPKIIRTIANMALGTGYGKIQIFMQDGMITQIKPEESVQVNENAVDK